MASSATLHSPTLDNPGATESFEKTNETTSVIKSDRLRKPRCASIIRKENKSKSRPKSAPVPPEDGYDDEIFLSPPPNEFQCIICLLTVREPHLFTCCGAIICKLCMLHIRAESECPHCRDTSSHLVVPDKRTKGQTMSLKVKCTNGDCEWRGELVDYNNHITEKCLFRVVQCQYGCGLYFIASEVAVHEEEECSRQPCEVTVQHYEIRHATLERRQQMSILKEKHSGESREELNHSLRKKKLLTLADAETTTKRMSLELNTVNPENKQTTYSYFTKEFPSWYGPLAATTPKNFPPCIRTMANFTKHKLNGDSWYSPPFYTGPGGYQLQLRVDSNGSLRAKGTHISVYVYLMLGVHDDYLGWPFKGSVAVKLLNWIEDKNHLEHSFSTTSAAEPQSFERVIDGIRAPGKMSQRQFIAHKELEFNSEKKTQYMMEDVLCFVISSVDVLSNYQPSLVPEWAYPELSQLSYGVLPVYRTVKDFNQLKESDDEYYSDPFYTTKGGYKICLCIYPNGYDSGKGTHISVFVCLMKAENNRDLPFPFNGTFTIQLLNWKQNAHHVEDSLTFDETVPVLFRQTTTEERAAGWGNPEYLSHVELEKGSDAEYINQDMLCFRIQFHPLFEPIQQRGSPVPSWCDIINSESATPPCTRTLYNYTAYKRTTREWRSQPFYSRNKAYKLQLSVYVNGAGSGTGTHLSLYVFLLKGEYDDWLEWPFHANITVQLLNWIEDNSHKQKTIHHYIAPLEYRTRVTEGDTAPGGMGYCELIPHSVLEAVRSNVMYIGSDNICFRIVNVQIVY